MALWKLSLLLLSSGATAFSIQSPPASSAPPLPRIDRVQNLAFRAPLLEYGYRPAVEEYRNVTLQEKPLLLYLPGFDGSFLSAFLQFPELHTVFDVRTLTIAADDRSSFDDLRREVLEYLASQRQRQEIYLAGESFGGILAASVAASSPRIDGLTLINAATCYDRSALAAKGPSVAAAAAWWYPLALATSLGPLFADEYSIQQLLLILQAEALPSVIDDAVREAYMGRVAFSLPWVVPQMPQETLQWRLQEWLEVGCAREIDWRRLQSIPTLIVAAERDRTLPSIDEAERLGMRLPQAVVRVVEGAGHASTCGSRADLAAWMKGAFGLPGRTERKEGTDGKGEWLGMEPRYDGASIGLNPLRYWSKKYYERMDPEDLAKETKTIRAP